MATLASVIGRGDTASRPAAGTAGRLYYDTDTSTMYRDNGSTWDSVEGDPGVSYTDEQAQDAVAAMIAAGSHTGITPTYVDATPSLSFVNDITQYTNEMAQDAVGGMVSNTGSISLTYDDVTPGLTAEANFGVDAGEVAEGDHTHIGLTPGAHTHPTADLSDLLVSSPQVGQVLRWNGTDWVNTYQYVTLNVPFYNGGDVLDTGVYIDVVVDDPYTIVGATMMVDPSGSLVVDIWKDTYANFPPVNADSITASAPVTVSAGVKSQDVTLTGWTVAIASGDILRFNIDSVTDVEQATLALKLRRA